MGGNTVAGDKSPTQSISPHLPTTAAFSLLSPGCTFRTVRAAPHTGWDWEFQIQIQSQTQTQILIQTPITIQISLLSSGCTFRTVRAASHHTGWGWSFQIQVQIKMQIQIQIRSWPWPTSPDEIENFKYKYKYRVSLGCSVVIFRECSYTVLGGGWLAHWLSDMWTAPYKGCNQLR